MYMHRLVLSVAEPVRSPELPSVSRRARYPELPWTYNY